MPEKSNLKRELGLVLLSLYGLGNILGAGIYVLVGKVAGEAGMGAPLSFLVAAGIAALTGFSYMELTSRYPVSAGASIYVHEGFGKVNLSRIVGFLIVLSGVVSASALSQGFAGYLRDFLQIDGWILSLGMLLAMGGIVARGIRETAWLAATFTAIEIVGLVAIIWFGREHLALDSPQVSGIFQPGGLGVSGVLLGAFLAFYAYIGYEDMANVAEEAKQPHRTMPMAILFSLVASTVLYLLVVLVSLGAVPIDQLAKSESPLSEVFSAVSRIDHRVISFIGVAAAINGTLVQMVMGSRMLYGMSRKGWLPEKFSSVNAKTDTPLFSTGIVVALMLIGAILLPLVSLAQLTSLLVLTVFALVNVALIRIKKQKEPPEKYFPIPAFLPWVAAASSVALIVFQIVDAVGG